ncbi:putative uracil-DNA glycosylase [Taylorella asinigenitalis 14/45]|uniref:Putative uracil-DNA glycosylase n=1 Tax=Taylorella asinigenitalis 14/45 TaxID=1091495 RepID=I7J147_9BURK|nr:uracil-DNA glycosylase family protein [Taylorella asinigenitalis]CCG19332.1 putative uracil-DNA glycosylase [Taylorella asinigenitalis 14/45]
MQRKFSHNQIQWLKQLGVEGLWGEKFKSSLISDSKKFEESKVRPSDLVKTEDSSLSKKVFATKDIPSIDDISISTEPSVIDTNILKIKGFTDLKTWYLDTYRKWNVPIDTDTLVMREWNGSEDFRLMIFEESPNLEDVIVSTQFNGEPGELLDNMIAQLGVKKEQVYISSFYKTDNPNFLSNDQNKLLVEVFKREIELINPKVLWCFDTSLLAILTGAQKVTHNQVTFELSINNKSIPLICSFNPRVVIENSNLKANVWRDLNKIEKLLHS